MTDTCTHMGRQWDRHIGKCTLQHLIHKKIYEHKMEINHFYFCKTNFSFIQNKIYINSKWTIHTIKDFLKIVSACQ